MPYLATWTIFVDGEDLTPFEVARKAIERRDEPAWKIVDIDTGKIYVINIQEESVLFQSDEQPSDHSGPNPRSTVGTV